MLALPWFFTVVGRFVRQVNFREIELSDALYFTRTGATFDVLSSKGMQKESQFHHFAEKRIIVPDGGIKIPWTAKTPWVKG